MHRQWEPLLAPAAPADESEDNRRFWRDRIHRPGLAEEVSFALQAPLPATRLPAVQSLLEGAADAEKVVAATISTHSGTLGQESPAPTSADQGNQPGDSLAVCALTIATLQRDLPSLRYLLGWPPLPAQTRDALAVDHRMSLLAPDAWRLSQGPLLRQALIDAAWRCRLTSTSTRVLNTTSWAAAMDDEQWLRSILDSLGRSTSSNPRWRRAHQDGRTLVGLLLEAECSPSLVTQCLALGVTASLPSGAPSETLAPLLLAAGMRPHLLPEFCTLGKNWDFFGHLEVQGAPFPGLHFDPGLIVRDFFSQAAPEAMATLARECKFHRGNVASLLCKGASPLTILKVSLGLKDGSQGPEHVAHASVRVSFLDLAVVAGEQDMVQRVLSEPTIGRHSTVVRQAMQISGLLLKLGPEFDHRRGATQGIHRTLRTHLRAPGEQNRPSTPSP